MQKYFDINNRTGIMFVSGVLDAETATQVVLTVNVTDINGILHTPQFSTGNIFLFLIIYTYKYVMICHGTFEIVPQEVLWSIWGSHQTL